MQTDYSTVADETMNRLPSACFLNHFLARKVTVQTVYKYLAFISMLFIESVKVKQQTFEAGRFMRYWYLRNIREVILKQTHV